MPRPTKDFVRLAIREKPSGVFVSLIALRTTASFYGWDQTFPEWRGKWTGKLSPTRYVKAQPYNNIFGGTRRKIIICRSDDRHSTPAALTNQFRVTTDATFLDLVNIAQATKPIFGWMTSFNAKRIPWECWQMAELPDDYLSCDRCYDTMQA